MNPGQELVPIEIVLRVGEDVWRKKRVLTLNFLPSELSRVAAEVMVDLLNAWGDKTYEPQPSEDR